jgi:hypothetical protein
MVPSTGRSSGTLAILSAAAWLAGGVGLAAPAQAGDLGGNCCVDLEERIAELEATTARKGNRKVSLTVSGQVTAGLLYWDDGGADSKRNSRDLYVVDNTVAAGGTNIQFAGSAAINPNLSAGFQVIVGLDRGARINHVSQADDDGIGTSGGASDTAIVITHANWYLDHKELGRVTVGRTNLATVGITGIDLGGAGVVASASSLGYWNSNFFLNESETAQWGDLMGTGRVWGSGLARANAISYNSPTFGGFQFAAAWGENDLWDVALRYAGEVSGFRLAAGVGYTYNVGGFGEANNGSDLPTNFNATPTSVKGSASVLHVASGLFLTGAYMDQDNDNGLDNTTLWYLQGGITKNWTGLGNTVLYGEYAKIEDGANACGTGGTAGYVGGGCRNEQDYGSANNGHFALTDSEVNVWGIGVVQNIDAAAMELFLAYRHYDGEATSVHAENFDYEMDLVFGGARIKF